MARRLDLHALLVEITTNVYFQPPENLALQYPCIVYNRDSAKSEAADNLTYRYFQRYQVTVIALDPDTEIPLAVKELPMCIYSRYFIADQLNHDVFSIYF